MQISAEAHKDLIQTMSALQQERLPFWRLWQELANYYLPKRYVSLATDKDRRLRNAKNPNIIDATGTSAARLLAAGMMNGVTSPARPWFSIRVPGFTDDPQNAGKMWADEVTRRMQVVMGETNFYNALATLYLDLSVFGTAAMLIYEDERDVFRCFNPALGEYYFGQDFGLRVNTFAREFTMTVRQIVAKWGVENCSETTKAAFKTGAAQLQQEITIYHIIEPNDTPSAVPKAFDFRETYWEKGQSTGLVLSQKGFYESLPGIFPRWEVTGNDSYGTSPAMDALGDVIQLQLESKRKAQGLDKMVRPPLVADVQLQHQPTALVPDGITYVSGINNVGVKPLYQVQLPIAELSADILDVRARIKNIFHNDLFDMISQLSTVRSATEIDARREEKLVLLGSVLERFENEALDPAINRIYQIMDRAGLIPEPPEEIAGAQLQIQYVSILSTAQQAVAAIPTERFLGMIGQVSGAAPIALQLPNWDRLLRNYADAIGVKARDLNTPEQVEALMKSQEEQLAAQNAAVQGKELVDGARTLSETDVGGGSNALQQVLGTLQ